MNLGELFKGTVNNILVQPRRMIKNAKNKELQKQQRAELGKAFGAFKKRIFTSDGWMPPKK